MASSSRPATGTTVFVENENAERTEGSRDAPAAAAAPPQIQSPHSLVSTALGLVSEEKQRPWRRRQPDALFCSAPSSSSLFAEEFSAPISHQKKEIEQFLLAQGEQLRRAMAERLRVHHRAFSIAVGESAAQRLRMKELEVERLERRQAELEDCIGRLREESAAWQAKAVSDQRSAASLYAQLQQAAAATSTPPPGIQDASGDTPTVEDAESACGDADRGNQEPACRSCWRRRATLVLFPCRHLAPAMPLARRPSRARSAAGQR